MERISWYDFSFWGNEKIYVNQALDSTWLSGGAFIEKFESMLSEELQLPNALAVANGTAALQLAFLGIDIEPGDEVIVPAFGFMAAANVLKLMHATPVFVDVDEDDWCMNPSLIESKITPRTKAIVVIHNYGVVSDMNKIAQIAKHNKLLLIEDCAESVFSKFDGTFAGNFGDLSTFSFHATKTVATGEGGMVSCKNEVLLEKLKLIRSHGLKRDKKHYWHEYFGNNFRISNILAAIGFGQLEQHEVIRLEKRRVSEQYLQHLQKIDGIRFQKFPENSEPVLWAVSIFVDPEVIKISRDELMLQLSDMGIECRPGFYTPNQLNLYKEISGGHHPVANRLAENIIVLPSFPKLSNDSISHICKTLKNIIKNVQVHMQ